ncbi:hypothetical protein MJ588_22990 [Klebsiella pneumoniae]|nr:hypothetical protein MJ588_22990 [Klebsiella pneumoniae]
MRITPETLRMQAAIAQDAGGRDRLAVDFEAGRRAHRGSRRPNPLRSTTPCAHTVPPQAELLAIADDLEHRYQARLCAAFVREA